MAVLITVGRLQLKYALSTNNNRQRKFTHGGGREGSDLTLIDSLDVPYSMLKRKRSLQTFNHMLMDLEENRIRFFKSLMLYNM